MKEDRYHISSENADRRIDVVASVLSGISRSRIQRFIEEGSMLVNDLKVRPNYKSHAGDIISIIIPKPANNGMFCAEDLPIEIMYRDAYVIVINKPANMVVYPSAGHNSGTLMNAVAWHSSKLASVGAPLRPGVVHRLDKDTSGVMVVALDDAAYYNLVEQFKKRTINRKYKALIYGTFKENSGEILLKIGRSDSDRKKMSTKTSRGKEAVTTWNVVERYRGATLIDAKLGTGRTHQIRVHLSSIGHPVFGDKTYGKMTSLEVGNKKIFFSRQMLHAELLGFVHPATGCYLEFSNEPPEDMRTAIEELRECCRIKNLD
jgi:23S rRNA pseudouridine1911/1915/1917 synthase